MQFLQRQTPELRVSGQIHAARTMLRSGCIMSVTREELRLELERELARYPTKEDLKLEFARELARYPTKEDLRVELARFATKDDLADVRTQLVILIEDLKSTMITLF